MNASSSDVARFMSFVEILPNGCWFWTGARSRGEGYGSFKVGGTAVRAHRFSHDVIGGKVLPSGWHRDHTCRFSLCVCPEHVENRVEKQRRLCPLGARNGRALRCSP